jgi:hypothetical protein
MTGPVRECETDGRAGNDTQSKGSTFDLQGLYDDAKQVWNGIRTAASQSATKLLDNSSLELVPANGSAMALAMAKNKDEAGANACVGSMRKQMQEQAIHLTSEIPIDPNVARSVYVDLVRQKFGNNPTLNAEAREDAKMLNISSAMGLATMVSEMRKENPNGSK